MSKKDKREKHKNKEAEWAKKNKGGFESTTIKLPTDVEAFRMKSGKATRIDIIPYNAGAGNPNADKGEEAYERTYFVHKNIGPDQKWVVCLAIHRWRSLQKCSHFFQCR